MRSFSSSGTIDLLDFDFTEREQSKLCVCLCPETGKNTQHLLTRDPTQEELFLHRNGFIDVQ